MDFNNLFNLITPEMVQSLTPLVSGLLSESLHKPDSPTNPRTNQKTTFKTSSNYTTLDEKIKSEFTEGSTLSSTPSSTPSSTSKNQVNDCIDDMLRKMLPIMLKTVFKIDPTLELIFRNTLKEIDEENTSQKTFPFEMTVVSNKEHIKEDNKENEHKEDTTNNEPIIEDYSDDDFSVIKLHYSDVKGNFIPEEILNVYSYCRSKPDTYLDLLENEWSDIHCIKSMMYASIITIDNNALKYLCECIRDLSTNIKETLEFLSHLTRMTDMGTKSHNILLDYYYSVLSLYNN